MGTLQKSQFSFKKFTYAGKSREKIDPVNGNDTSHEVEFTDENGKKYVTDITDIYRLNIFQFDNPTQQDMIKAKNWIIENSEYYAKF